MVNRIRPQVLVAIISLAVISLCLGLIPSNPPKEIIACAVTGIVALSMKILERE